MGAFFITLLGIAYALISPFLGCIAWAIILGSLLHPFHKYCLAQFKTSRNASALLVTSLFSSFLILIILIGLYAAWNELPKLVLNLQKMLNENILASRIFSLYEVILRPYSTLIAPYHLADATGSGSLSGLIQSHGQTVFFLTKKLTNIFFQLACTMVLLFFVLKHHDLLVSQFLNKVNWIFESNKTIYLQDANAVLMLVTKSILVTSFAQGFLAFLGFWAAGVSTPFTFGLATIFLSIIPFGSSLLWLVESINLLMNGKFLYGTGLFLWGLLIVSTVDNILRPYLISSKIKVPFLLILISILSGIFTFGFIGIYIGPLVIAIFRRLQQNSLLSPTNPYQ